MTKCALSFCLFSTSCRLKESIRIIRIPFIGSVRLKSLLLKSGPGDQTPSKIALVHTTICLLLSISLLFQFANAQTLDFDDINDETPTQELGIPQSREVGEYSLKYVCSAIVEKR